MTLMLLALALTSYGVPIEVEGWSYSEDPVFLVCIETADSTVISISDSPDELEYTIMGYVTYPGMYNPAKAYASYDEETRVLSVYSQYPYSANYYLATYRLDDDGELTLLEADSHDAYLGNLENMQACLAEGDHEGILEETWYMMYPGGNPYGREMCIVLLQAGLAEAEIRMSEGTGPSESLEWMDEADDAARDLAGTPIHEAILAPAEYPEDASIPMEEYVALLDEYAGLLELAGITNRAEEVRAIATGLVGVPD